MFVPLIGYLGVQPFNDWFLADTQQRLPLGAEIPAVDQYWGQGSFLYVKATAGALAKGTAVIWDEAFNAVAVPNTANQGFPLGVVAAPIPVGGFGWIQTRGLAVYRTGSTVAADAAIGITAAGVLGTNAAGKQVLGVRNRRSATATVVLNASTVQNSNVLQTNGYDGLFLGMALSGTGIPASTVVAKLEADGRTVLMGSAIGTTDRVATATGLISLTGTYTGYGAGVLYGPIAQGAIT